MTLALIDGDIVAYRAAAGQQRSVDWDDGDAPFVSSNTPASKEAAFQTIAAWMKLAKCRDAIVTFTGTENFRKRVLPTYKANRKGAKPFAYMDTVSAIASRFETRRVEGLEADDLMGIMVTSDTYEGAIVLTIDKDLRGVPGRHMNPLKETRPVTVRETDANRMWLYQALTGDTVDGYGGLPSCGPVKANKLLHGRESVGDLWDAVLGAYLKAGKTLEDALVMARVARILRRCDYDKQSKEILLWHPTTPVRIPLIASVSATPSDALTPTEHLT